LGFERYIPVGQIANLPYSFELKNWQRFKPGSTSIARDDSLTAIFHKPQKVRQLAKGVNLRTIFNKEAQRTQSFTE